VDTNSLSVWFVNYRSKKLLLISVT